MSPCQGIPTDDRLRQTFAALATSDVSSSQRSVFLLLFEVTGEQLSFYVLKDGNWHLNFLIYALYNNAGMRELYP
jgi:hypothetical protein